MVSASVKRKSEESSFKLIDFTGMLAQIVPEKGDAYAVHLRVIMLFTGGLMAVHGSELIKYEGAGPLAIVFAAFTSNYFW